MNIKTHIKNGTVVTPEKTFVGDVLIDGETIAAVGTDLTAEGAEVHDAEGCYVMPGGVDVHTHLNLQLGDRKVSDGFQAGTVSAAWGGTTTIVDHPEAGPAGCSLLHQPDFYRCQLEREAVVDFGIHGVFQHLDDDVLREIPTLIKAGYSSSKIYMTYPCKLSQAEAKKALARLGQEGGLATFHAEQDAEIARLRTAYADEGKLAPVFHAKSRPDYTEADSIKEIAEIAAQTGAPVYIVHLSTAKGLDVIREARKSGVKMMAETCPQYLLLDESCYEREDGLKFIMAPPLRERPNCEALWEGVMDGTIGVVATDHCSFSYADKLRFWNGDFRLAPGGSPGVEARLPLLFSEGVLKRKMSVEKFVDLVATNPARVMGMDPRKGSLKPGADADVLIWDPKIEKTISPSTLHQKCDFSPFDGMQVTGWPRTTFLRGQALVQEGQFAGRPGSGRYLNRTPFSIDNFV